MVVNCKIIRLRCILESFHNKMLEYVIRIMLVAVICLKRRIEKTSIKVASVCHRYGIYLFSVFLNKPHI